MAIGEGRGVFEILAICYLFFGGVGAGVIIVASFIDLMWVKEPFGVLAVLPSAQAIEPCYRLQAFTFLTGLCAVAFGILCLMFDLGRLDRLEALFLSPSVSFLTIGAFALAGLVVLGAFLALVRFCSFPVISRSVVVVVEAMAMAFGVVVMVYTGMMLQSFGSVAFWDTPLVPVLFVLSSLSAGCAVTFIVGFAVEADTDIRALHIVRVLAFVDLAIVVLEALCAIVFVLLALDSSRESAVLAARLLVEGDGWLAMLWWVGFVCCGMMVPLALEVVSSQSNRADCRTKMVVLALAGVFVLVGALSLRFSVADAGVHRTLVLEDVRAVVFPASQLSGELGGRQVVDLHLVADDVVIRSLNYEWQG